MVKKPTYEELEQRIKELEGKEEELRESEEKYRLLIDNSDHPITVFDRDGRLKLINIRGAKNLGATPKDLIGKSIDELFPDMADVLIERNHKVIELGVGNYFEDVFELPSGKRWFWSNLQPIKAPDGKVNAVQIISYDITERKRAEDELRQSEERYRDLVESARDMVYTVSLDARITSGNQAFEKITGWKSSEIIGENLTAFVHPDDWPLAEKMGLLCIQGEKPPIHEVRVLTKSGEYITGEFSITPLIKDDEIVGILGIGRDITERKRTEEALRESEKRYEMAVKGGNVGVWDWNLKTDEIFVAPNLKAMLGYEDHEISNRIEDWASYVHPSDESKVMAEAEANIKGTSEKYRVEHRMRHKDGSVRWFLASGKVERDSDGTAVRFIGTDTDITERKQAEEALKIAHDELEQRVEERTAELKKANRELNKEIQDRKRSEEALIMTKARLQYLLDVSPAVIYSAKTSGDYSLTFISQNIREQSGYEAHEFVDNPKFWSAHIHPDDAPQVLKDLPRLLDNDNHCREYRFMNKDGNYRWLHDESRVVCDENGKPLEIVGYLIDITVSKEAEERLRESEEMYSTVVKNSKEGIIIIQDKKIVYVNPVVEKLSPFSKKEVFSEDFPYFIHPEDRAALIQRYLQVKEGKQLSEYQDYRIVDKKNNTRWVTANSTKINYRGKPAVLVFLTDITERKLKEEELRKREQELSIKSRSLEETNTALRVLLEKRERDKAELAGSIQANVKELVMPYLERLDRKISDQTSKAYLGIIESTLSEIISPFLHRLSLGNVRLTPAQIQVANLVKEGKTTKEISELLTLSVKTIEDHRKSIRKKLGILNKKVNLKSYLSSFSQQNSYEEPM